MAHRLANRVRLVFDPPTILPLKFRKKDLQNCWFQLPIDLPCVSDFAEHLIADFELQQSCPRGIKLQVDGFSLPPSQPLSLLKDDDIIRICRIFKQKKRRELSELEDEQYQTPLLPYSQAGAERGGGGGGNANGLLALTFPGSTSKDEDKVYTSDDNAIDDNEEYHFSGGTKKTGSRRKTVREAISKEEGRETCSEEDEFVENTRGQSKKRKADGKAGEETVKKKLKVKKGSTGAKDFQQLQDLNEAQFHESGGEPRVVAIASRKGKEVKNEKSLKEKSDEKGKGKARIDKVRGKVKVQHSDANVVTKNYGDGTELSESSEESEELRNSVVPVVQKNQSKASKATTAMPKEASTSSSQKRNNLMIDNGDMEGDPEGEKKQKEGPSRSARRKKAKRLWLRNQAEAKKSETNEHIPIPESKPASNIVVKGHVRFGDEDGQPVAMPVVTPILNLAPITNKRHGQAWGQQKGGRDMWQSKKENFMEFTRPNDGQNDKEWVTNHKQVKEDDKKLVMTTVENSFQNRDYESLPPLTDSPKIGDVLAYQLVELTSSWAPELSPFREGRVTSFDAVSGQITVVPIGGPGTPIGGEKEMEKKMDVDAWEEGEEEGERERDRLYPTAYEEDGTLQVDFPSLLNVRILETSSSTGIDEHILPVLGTVSTETSNIPSSDKERVSSETETETNKIRSSILDYPDLSPPASERRKLLPRLEDFTQLSRPSQTPPNTPLGQGFSMKENAFNANQIMDLFAGIETVNNNSSMAVDSDKYPVSPNLNDSKEVIVEELVDTGKEKGKGKEKENENGEEKECKKVVSGAKGEENQQEMSPWTLWADISRDLEKRRAELAVGLGGSKTDTKLGVNFNKNTANNEISPATTKPIATPEAGSNKVGVNISKKSSIQAYSPSTSKSISTTNGKKVKGGHTGSLRTIRAAAMGPTLALLRSENSQSETKVDDN